MTSAYQVTIKQLYLWQNQFQALHELQQKYMAAIIQYYHWFHLFVHEGIRVW